jgi:hypothetical protein
VSYPGSRFDRNPSIAPELETALRETFQPGASVSLEKAAAILGQLDGRQLWLVCETILGVSPIADADTYRDLGRARAYARFSADQRKQLLEGSAIQFSELDDDLQGQVLMQARGGWRQWLTMSEMENTVIRAERQEDAGGEPCLQLIYDYRFEGSPKDRDVIAVPLRIAIPAETDEAETPDPDDGPAP